MDIKITVKTLRKVAIILPVDTTRKVLAAGKVRTDWALCRLRKQMGPKLCFRYLVFGDITKACTSSKECWKCAAKNHISKDSGLRKVHPMAY